VTAEYAVIVGLIAVGCIVALLWLGKPINALFHEPTNLPNEQPFTPPVHQSDPSAPASLEDCLNGGWQSFGFASQADCEAYVNSH
jgi:hypothetical protein